MIRCRLFVTGVLPWAWTYGWCGYSMLYMASGVDFFQVVVEVVAFGGASVLEVVYGLVEAGLFGFGRCFADLDDIVELQQGGNQTFDGWIVGVILQCDGFHGCEVF